MALDNHVTRYLDRVSAEYRLIEHPESRAEEAMGHCDLPKEKLLRAQVLQERSGLFVVVLPANTLIDFVALRTQFGTRPEPVPPETLARLFHDCDSGCVVPIGAPYDLPTAMDERIARMGKVYLQVGDRRHLLEIDGSELVRIGHTLPLGRISRSGNSGKPAAAEQSRQRIEALKQLPPLPQSTRKLLLLRNREEPDIQALAQVIEADPPLAAQLLGYARSSYFGFGGHVDTIETAINLVLGFDMALTTALAVSAAAPYRLPHSGRLGLERYWQRAILGATLTRSLCALLPEPTAINPPQAYLAALMRDIGLLAIGQSMGTEYRQLAQALEQESTTPQEELETRLIGLNHAQIGAWLLRRWGLPEMVVQVAAEHHGQKYSGDHADIIALVQLVDALLDIRESGEGELPSTALEHLGLKADEVLKRAEELLADSTPLTHFARQVAA